MFFLFGFLPLSSLERKRLKKASFILTEREDESQRARERAREDTSPLREEEGARKHAQIESDCKRVASAPALLPSGHD